MDMGGRWGSQGPFSWQGKGSRFLPDKSTGDLILTSGEELAWPDPSSPLKQAHSARPPECWAGLGCDEHREFPVMLPLHEKRLPGHEHYVGRIDTNPTWHIEVFTGRKTAWTPAPLGILALFPQLSVPSPPHLTPIPSPSLLQTN